jgi:hypothetical protein
MMTPAVVHKKFLEFDRRWFGGQLRSKSVSFHPLSDKHKVGWFCLWDDGSYGILLDLRLPPFALWISLLHEMVHLWCEVNGHADHWRHGLWFTIKRDELKRRGAFDKYL